MQQNWGFNPSGYDFCANLQTAELNVTPGCDQVTTFGDRPGPFREWLSGFVKIALATGIEETTLSGRVRYNREVARRYREQPEFALSVRAYLEIAAPPARISRGRAELRKREHLFARLEEEFGVNAGILAAIWGIESNFGDARGEFPVLDSLATLASLGIRQRFFSDQLTAALHIIQKGIVDESAFVGSWAGAMGHTQFMPRSYLDHAASLGGIRPPDIWCDDPADSLASTANYLARHGWTSGQPWGAEVMIAEDFDYLLVGSGNRTPGEWHQLGARLPDGNPAPDHGEASLVVPAGAGGPALMAFGNFDVIGQYNRSLSYMIAVGHLADRIEGKPGICGDWPDDGHGLSRLEIREMQKLLVKLGYDTGGIDGLLGPRTFSSIQRFQAGSGLIPDGFPSMETFVLLKTMHR